MNELKGVVSKLDITLYDIKEIPREGGVIQFFSQTASAVGKHRAILSQPNTIPSNWKSFTINAIGLKIFSENLSDYTILGYFIINSYYVFKIADYEIKTGHLSEFFNISTLSFTIVRYNIGNNILDLRIPFQLDMPRNLYVNLMKPIIIEPLINFQFIINYDGQIPENETTFMVGVYLKGILDRGIVG